MRIDDRATIYENIYIDTRYISGIICIINKRQISQTSIKYQFQL